MDKYWKEFVSKGSSWYLRKEMKTKVFIEDCYDEFIEWINESHHGKPHLNKIHFSRGLRRLITRKGGYIVLSGREYRESSVKQRFIIVDTTTAK